jgi:hypothetical protein
MNEEKWWEWIWYQEEDSRIILMHLEIWYQQEDFLVALKLLPKTIVA